MSSEALVLSGQTSCDGVHRTHPGHLRRHAYGNVSGGDADAYPNKHTTAVIVGRKRTFRDITSRLRSSEEESKRFLREWREGNDEEDDDDDDDNVPVNPLKRLRTHSSAASSYYCCMYTTTSLTTDQATAILEQRSTEERLTTLRAMLENIPKRQLQKAQTIAPLVRECMRLMKWCIDGYIDAQEETVALPLRTIANQLIPPERTASEAEARYTRPNRTFLAVSKRPWMDLQFLNEFGACRGGGDDSAASVGRKRTGNVCQVSSTATSSVDKRKRRGTHTSFGIALIVDGFGSNRRAAETFYAVMNNRSRGKIPRMAFGTLLADRWNLKFYGSLGAVFDARFAYHTMKSVDKRIIVTPRTVV